MTPLVAVTNAPQRGAHRATPVRRLIPLLLPLFGACAPVSTASRAAAPSPAIASSAQVLDAERVLWVRTPDPRTSASLSIDGEPVKVIAGAKRLRGDTVIAATTFAVALPADAFEMRITAKAALPGQPGINGKAVVEYTTVNARGELQRVQAVGADLVLRRAAADQPLEVAGASRRTVTRVSARSI